VRPLCPITLELHHGFGCPVSPFSAIVEKIEERSLISRDHGSAGKRIAASNDALIEPGTGTIY